MISPIVAWTRMFARLQVPSTRAGKGLVVLDPDVRMAHDLRRFAADDAPVAAVVCGLVKTSLDLSTASQLFVVGAPVCEPVRLLGGSESLACDFADQGPVKGNASSHDRTGHLRHEPDQDIRGSVWVEYPLVSKADWRPLSK